MRVHLKIKVKSLAAEAAIIRTEEAKRRNYAEWLRGPRPKIERGAERTARVPNGTEADIEATRAQVIDLAAHRRFVVRPEARHSHLAYGFLKGRAYQQMEAKVHNREYPDFKRIEAMVSKYGDGDSRDRMQHFAEWVDQAKAHLGLKR